MAATLAELAEETTIYLKPRPTFETVERDGYVYIAGLRGATVHRVRLGDVTAAVEWTRAESKRRGLRELTWWVGESATPDEHPHRAAAPRSRRRRRRADADRYDGHHAAACRRRRRSSSCRDARGLPRRTRGRLAGVADTRVTAGRASRPRGRALRSDVRVGRRPSLLGVPRRRARRLRPGDPHGRRRRALRRLGGARRAWHGRLPRARPRPLGPRGRARHAGPRRAGRRDVTPRADAVSASSRTARSG